MAESPSFTRRQFGAELRRMRTAAGRKLEEPAGLLRCTSSRLSRVETGQRGVALNEREVRDLARLYDMGRAETERLVDLWRATKGVDWWDRYAAVLPSGMDVLIGMEAAAETERVFEPSLVPGLLQTEAYARALHAADHGMSADAADQLVQMRMERQQVLTRASRPLELHAIVDEAALRRPVGGREVMRAQLTHLAELARDAENTVTLQLLPFSAGAHIGQGGGFALLEAAEESVVYINHPAGNSYLPKPRDVRGFGARFGWLQAAAADTRTSAEILAQITKEM